MGRPPDDLLRIVQRVGLRPVKDMFASQRGGAEDHALFYPTAWLMMHYLINHQRTALVAYQKAVQRWPHADAWARAFPELSAEKFDWVLRSYLDGGEYSLLIIPFIPFNPFNPPPPPASPPSPSPKTVMALAERTLTNADVHATRALLFSVAGRESAALASSFAPDELRMRAKEEIDEALRAEPASLLGQAVARWEFDAVIDVSHARAAQQSHQGDWMAWALLAEALRQNHIEDGRAAASRRAAELIADDSSVTFGVSFHRPLPSTSP